MCAAFRDAIEKYRLAQALLIEIRVQLVEVVSFGNDSGHLRIPGESMAVIRHMVRY